MASNNKSAMRRLVRKRDNAYDTLVFNEKYPEVASALIDNKNERLLKQQELKSKKKLLPLEIAALPEGERNAVRFERAINAFKQKQNLSRRAVKQAYLRKEKKAGEAEALKYREKAEMKLDSAVENKITKLKAAHPETESTEISAEAAALYETTLATETARLEAAGMKQTAEKEKKMNALTARLDRQNLKLRAVFESANTQLHEMSSVDAEKFGNDSILSIQNLKMHFSGIKAVDDLSFNIKQGEIFGLIGPNGAGKTTVFNCVTQFHKATGGNCFYRDRFDNLVDLADYKTPEVIKAGISRTFQNLELVYWLPIFDNLLVGAHAFYRSTLTDQFVHSGKLKREEEVFRRRALDLLDMLGISAYKDAYPLGLPYGILKKVELARTLMSSPRLIILDEPAAGLNDSETEALAEIIKSIRDDFGCTIFLVEHDMNLVMNVCDTVCAISFGKLLAIGTPDDIRNSPLVQEAYLGTE